MKFENTDHFIYTPVTHNTVHQLYFNRDFRPGQWLGLQALCGRAPGLSPQFGGLF